VRAMVLPGGGLDLPLPQFVLVGRQSVGKSRLLEALAGETFNFAPGQLGSRRPTVLEFRSVPTAKASRWQVRDRKTGRWEELPVERVAEIVGQANEELGETVSADPVSVRVESPACVDMQIVDLPSFCDFAMDASKQTLARQIEALSASFMRDKRNIMLCVEQAGDTGSMTSLQKCHAVDPRLERTILVRNKLDAFYEELTTENVGRWIDGHGHLPESLVRFALTLPSWKEGAAPTRSFRELLDDANAEDLRQMQSRGLGPKYLQTIGFKNFAAFLEKNVEKMFAESIGPVLAGLAESRSRTEKEAKMLAAELVDTEPERILSTTRDCGISFAMALTHVMEGVLNTSHAMTLEEELRAFHEYHKALGSEHFSYLPSSGFKSLEEYLEYLRGNMQLATFDVELNGGAQFRRLMAEVEVFLRFSEVSAETKKRDVIQARGVSMGNLTWRDVIVKLLSTEAHAPLQRRVQYVGERIKWFFERQKEAVLDFMDSLKGSPSASMYSPLYTKHAKLIKQNDMIKHLLFQTYDKACARQQRQFLELFDNLLTTTFSNPWVFLKGSTPGGAEGEEASDAALPSFEGTKERIPKEIQGRSGAEAMLSGWLTEIPSDAAQLDAAVEKVQLLVLRTYSCIRSQVCDQVELFAESFFKLPMMRRLEEDMACVELTADDTATHQAHRERLAEDLGRAQAGLEDIDSCVGRLQGFKLKCDTRLRPVWRSVRT